MVLLQSKERILKYMIFDYISLTTIRGATTLEPTEVMGEIYQSTRSPVTECVFQFRGVLLVYRVL